MKHFSNEEAFLEKYAYEHLQRHAEIHKTLVTRALELRRHVNQEAGVSVGQLVDFLITEVISRHMLNEDKKFAYLFSRERLGS